MGDNVYTWVHKDSNGSLWHKGKYLEIDKFSFIPQELDKRIHGFKYTYKLDSLLTDKECLVKDTYICFCDTGGITENLFSNKMKITKIIGTHEQLMKAAKELGDITLEKLFLKASAEEEANED